MKKLISAILAVVMLLSAITTVSAASFGDVKKSDWFYDSVNYVADKGIMKGTSSTEFAPNTTLSRAMAVTLLYRIAKTPSVSGVKLPFGDVKNGQWYTDAVKWAYDNGIVNGKSAKVFGTDDNITRAEFATILYRYLGKAGLMVPQTKPGHYVSDLADIPDWAFPAVNTLYQGEVINGKEGNVFDSYANITRAEAAALIERFVKKATKYVPESKEDESNIKWESVPTTGQIVVKEKKYNYDGAHVMILNVENQTETDINLTITAKFKDSKGNVLKTQTQTYEGFSGNSRNYFLFQPGIKFDSFSFETKATKFSGISYLKYIKYGTNVDAYPVPAVDDWNGDGKGYPPGEERGAVEWKYTMYNSYQQDLNILAHWVLFDKNGEIFTINSPRGSMVTGSGRITYRTRMYQYFDIFYKDFVFPEELNGKCTGIIAITEIRDYGWLS
ncbi:MAG: S-layer homology domain-containing protein [Clostridia bacterium]|nr:S-layer homology domain-containing protein [Clostridia bacterium]